MGSKDESEESLQELRKVMGDYDVAVYRAVKERRVQELSREGQILAKVIQEHLGVPHFHNALEFADVREGEPYIVNGVSPLAHLATHAAVEAMVEGGNAEMKAAYEKLLSTGVNGHHAAHVLGAIFLQCYLDMAKADEHGEPSDNAWRKCQRTLRKICTDSAFRRKWVRRFSKDHPLFEAKE